VGRTETELLSSARRAGIDLQGAGRVGWLSVYGHLEPSIQDAVPDVVLDALDQIFVALRGDRELLQGKRGGASPKPDARLGERGGAIVEIDEIQHFTTDRALTLQLYPVGSPLGFDRVAYLKLCERWAPSADRYRAAKQTTDFPHPGGRRAQRAYFDACRDLLAPHLDAGSVYRIPAPECDAQLAMARLRRTLGIDDTGRS
jgi:hypothetical protein